jgi:hypothetical protein
VVILLPEITSLETSSFCLFISGSNKTKPVAVSLSELQEEHLSSINVQEFNFKRPARPGLVNKFVPWNTRNDVFYEKYMLIKTSFHETPWCCFIHAP